MPDYGQPKRLTEITKCIPVIFVVAVIAVLYVTYVFCHCLPMMQLDVAAESRDKARFERAKWQLITFLVFSTMLIICLVRSILTSPGEVPDTSEWIYYGDQAPDEAPQTAPATHETKKTGERRHCKWCSKYKPDRCHHCRVCRKCILKMDHHCPWIYNCVGYYNHKYFFLLLFYSVIDCHLIFWTMRQSVADSVDPHTPFMKMFLLLFGETLAAFLGLLVTSFWFFHVWLMSKNMTTIEFCEKAMKKTGYDESAYLRRAMGGNLKAVLGENVLTWMLPICSPGGDGLNFVSEDIRLVHDLEQGRGSRRKAHQKSQQRQRRQTRSAGTGGAPGSGQSAGSAGDGEGSMGEGSAYSAEEHVPPREDVPIAKKNGRHSNYGSTP